MTWFAFGGASAFYPILTLMTASSSPPFRSFECIKSSKTPASVIPAEWELFFFFDLDMDPYLSRDLSISTLLTSTLLPPSLFLSKENFLTIPHYFSDLLGVFGGYSLSSIFFVKIIKH